MGMDIYRAEYHSIPKVNGREDANFIIRHFREGDNGTFYIDEETVNELLNSGTTNNDEKAILKALKKEVKEHGDFDVMLSS